MQKIREYFRTRMAARLWLALVGTVLCVTLCILLLAAVLFNGFMMGNAAGAGARQTQAAASDFDRSFRDMMERMVRRAASADFVEHALAAASADDAGFTAANNALQDDIDAFIHTSDLVRTAMVVTPGSRPGWQPHVYHFYGQNPGGRTEQLLDFDLTGVQGITMLPAATDPVYGGRLVIPLVVPLYFNTNSLLLVQSDPARADVILYLFLDAQTVADHLALSCDEEYRGTLYLARADGTPLSLAAGAEGPAADPTLRALLGEAAGRGERQLRYKGDYVYLEPVSVWDGLYLVNILPQENLLAWRDTIFTLLLLIALTSVGAITLLCTLLSSSIARPMHTLTETVRKIEDGRYDGQMQFPGRQDEIGQLERALDTMQKTIVRQMHDIRATEQEKFNTQMQLLTEQINPHFLYNTLEFINMEVLTGRPENASRMIAALGEYCRISLAYGDNAHSIARELDQAAAYVDIMSDRFSHAVELVVDVPPALREKMLLKCTLQPLVENSLKHGFDLSGGGVPLPPKVRVAMRVEGADFVIAVTDNGQGIDIPRAEKILREGRGGQKDRHIGLHNIYERLRAYYGRADFTFTSAPYFENTVEIRLPARFFDSCAPGPAAAGPPGPDAAAPKT